MTTSNLNKMSDLFTQAKSIEIDVPTQFGQGRATLGGIVGGVLFAHLHEVVGTDNPPRSLTVSFIGPVQSGVKAQLSAEIFRKGKSVIQAQSRLVQDGQVMATMLASFGTARESSIYCPSIKPPSMIAADLAIQFPYIEGVVPEFIKQIDMRISEGNKPFSGTTESGYNGYMRFADKWQNDEFGLAHLISLVDVWPPSVLPMLEKPSSASSLAWTMEFIREPEEILANASMQTFWKYAVDTDYANDGYAHSRANIWNEQDELVIISRQTVTVFG